MVPPLPRKPNRLPPPLPRKAWRHLPAQDLRKFKNLLFAARTVVDGIYTGRHRSPYRDRAPEFVEYRHYHPGDALELVDWKAYARTDRHYIRMAEKETDMQGHVLLDCSASMAFAPPPAHGSKASRVSKMDYAATLAASLAYLLIKQGDQVSLTLFDQKLRQHIPTGGTFAHLYRLLNAMERQKPAGATDLAETLRRCNALFRRRGLVMVISDFYGDPDELFRALSAYRHRRFEVILFHLLHEQEINLPEGSHLRLEDAETGEVLSCDPADVRAAYAGRLAAFREGLRARAGARGIRYQFCHTGQPHQEVLYRYLSRHHAGPP